MKNFKFQFETAPAKKGQCPNCKRLGCFRYYVGVPKEYGICDRINSCGWHSIPGKGVQPALNESPPELKLIKPTRSQLECLNYTTSSFHVFCNTHLKIPTSYLRRWGVGTTGKYTNFIYIDINAIPRNVISIQYNLHKSGTDCKRNKNALPFSLKAPPGNRYELCLYGEHLLTDKPVCIVESEKTAVIASFFYPEFDWLASGGANKLTLKKTKVLENKKVIFLSDSDNAGTKNTSIRNLQIAKINFRQLNLFPNRNDGYDLADAIIEGFRPIIL